MYNVRRKFVQNNLSFRPEFLNKIQFSKQIKNDIDTPLLKLYKLLGKNSPIEERAGPGKIKFFNFFLKFLRKNSWCLFSK